MNLPKSRKEYVEFYYNLHLGKIDLEAKIVGNFLSRNVSGKVLDCGCGPVPQIWAICMPYATEIHAIDIVKESIKFVNDKLKNKGWWNNLIDYQKITEKVTGHLSNNYIIEQINKIKSIKQADMTRNIPFEDNYFDTVVSLYSLGVLKNINELESAIKNIARVLKRNGKLLHINSNGKNSNSILPEYTWKGLPQASKILKPVLKKYGFEDIKIIEFNVKSKSIYKYNKIYLLSAIKK